MRVRWGPHAMSMQSVELELMMLWQKKIDWDTLILVIMHNKNIFPIINNIFHHHLRFLSLFTPIGSIWFKTTVNLIIDHNYTKKPNINSVGPSVNHLNSCSSYIPLKAVRTTLQCMHPLGVASEQEERDTTIEISRGDPGESYEVWLECHIVGSRAERRALAGGGRRRRCVRPFVVRMTTEAAAAAAAVWRTWSNRCRRGGVRARASRCRWRA